MANDGVPRINKLDTDNYLQWSMEIEHIMRLKGCWPAVAPTAGVKAEEPQAMTAMGQGPSDGAGVSGSGTRPAAAQTAEEAKMEEQAMALLVLNCRSHHQATFRLYPTARGDWQALEREFRSRGVARMAHLRLELAAMKMGKNEPVVRYFNRGRTVAWELQALGAVIDDKQLIATLLSGIPPQFDQITTVLLTQDNLTVIRAQEHLQACEARFSCRDKRAAPEAVEGSAMAAVDGAKGKSRPGGQRRRIKCFNCNKLGHIARECRAKGGGQEDEGSGGMADLAMMARAITNVREGAASDAGGNTSVGWVIDSGASHHMTGHASDLVDIHDCEAVRIMLAGGEACTAISKGRALLKVNGSNPPVNLELKDVLLVPGLVTPLFSVRQAAVNGFQTVFGNGEALIKRKGATVLHGVMKDKLYTLPVVTSNGAAMVGAAKVPAITWHRRFGHLGAATLSATAKVVTGMTLYTGGLQELRDSHCTPCIQGKMTRAPFPLSTSTTTAPLEIIVTDTCGPMPDASAGGNRYLTTVIDVHTRFKAAVPHKTRGEAKDVVITTVNRWETQTGNTAKVLRSDGALDFSGARWDDWIETKGIQHQRTTAHTPESNGIAERYNRTIMERTVALLADGKLAKKWWAEAALTANYLSNRVPQRGHDVTPYEAFYGKRPDVSHLRTFGCEAWAYTPGDVRRKMQPRACKGTFLGYGVD